MAGLPKVITDRMSVVVIANNRMPAHDRQRRETADAQLEQLVKAFPGVECRVCFDGVPMAGFVPA